jgi:hypothetical protein
LIDPSNPTNKTLVDKYQFVDHAADTVFGGIGLKLKPVTGSTPTITLSQALVDIGVRFSVSSLQKMNMLMVSHVKSLPQVVTSNNMYVELRWSGSNPGSLNIPANTWTTLPYNQIGRNRNFDGGNLGSSLYGGVGSIFLPTAGLYLITGGWRTQEQSSTSVNTTAIQVNDDVLRKDGVTNGSNNNQFTFLELIYPEELLVANGLRAQLLIQVFLMSSQNLASSTATLTDDREPPVWCHITFLG